MKSVALQLFEKSKISFFSLAEDIYLLDRGPTSKIDIASTCNSREQLTSQGTSPLYICPNAKNPLFSKSERKEKLSKLYELVTNEMEMKKNPNLKKKPLLLDRSQHQNTCKNKKISILLISEINHKATLARLAYLLKTSPITSSLSATSLSIRERVLAHNKNSLIQGDRLIPIAFLKKDPLTNYLYNSKFFFNKIKEENFNLSLIEAHTKKIQNSQKFKDEVKASLKQKCINTYKAIEQSICADQDDILLPRKAEDLTDILGYNSENATDLMESSYLLSSQYCQESRPSLFDSIDNLTTNNLRPQFNNAGSLEDAIEEEHYATTIPTANLICEYLPPPADKLAKHIAETCSDAEPYDQRCIILKATQSVLSAHVEEKKAEVTNIVLAQAKENGVTDKETIDQMQQELESKVDSGDVLDDYTEYKVAKAKGKSITNDFLGVSPSKEESSEQSKKNELAEKSPSQGLENAKLSGASDADKYYAKIARIDKKRRKDIKSFFDDVTSRITDFSKKNAAFDASTNSGYASQSIDGSNNKRPSIADYMGSPFPKNTRPSSTKNSGYSGDPSFGSSQTNRGFAKHPTSTTNSESTSFSNTPRQGAASRETSHEVASRKYNKALGGTAAAKNVFKRREPTAVAGPSPFKTLNIPAKRDLSRYTQQEWPLDPERIDNDIEALIDGVIAEKKSGEDGENTEHAKYILKMLNSKNQKAFTIVSNKNKNYQVEVLKTSKGEYIVKKFGNFSDPQYKKFVKSVEKSIIKVKKGPLNSKFIDLIGQLKFAVKNGERMIIRRDSGSSYTELGGFN